MAIETSIYQILKPIETPSMLDSMQKASNLSSMAMQQKRMGQQMQTEEQQAKYQAHLQKASVYGNALESMAGMSPEERQAAYPKMREEMLRSGIIGPQDAPPEHDEGLYRQNLMKFRQSKEGMEKQLAAAQIGHLKAQDTHLGAQNQYLGAQAQKEMREAGRGQRLPADKVLAVSEGQRLPTMLSDIKTTLDSNSGEFGPVAGRLASWNPYNEKAQTIDAQMRSASQSFGRLMEGGVLRKEDEEKYRKMFPKLSDDQGVAKNKLALVDRLLKQKHSADVDALAQSGYDTSAFGEGRPAPELPRVLTQRGNGKRSKGLADDVSEALIGTAQAANSNPNAVRMIGPDGKMRMVPREMVGEAIAAGGKRVK